jgi:hypothetical protein
VVCVVFSVTSLSHRGGPPVQHPRSVSVIALTAALKAVESGTIPPAARGTLLTSLVTLSSPLSHHGNDLMK